MSHRHFINQRQQLRRIKKKLLVFQLVYSQIRLFSILFYTMYHEKNEG